MPDFIKRLVVISGYFSIFPWWDDWCHPLHSCLFNNGVGIVSTIRQKIVGHKAIDQCFCLGTICCCTLCNNRPDRHAMRIYGQMQFCVEPLLLGEAQAFPKLCPKYHAVCEQVFPLQPRIMFIHMRSMTRICYLCNLVTTLPSRLRRNTSFFLLRVRDHYGRLESDSDRLPVLRRPKYPASGRRFFVLCRFLISNDQKSAAVKSRARNERRFCGRLDALVGPDSIYWSHF